MKVDMGVAESDSFVLGKSKRKQEYEGCIRCLELYDKITNADNKCLRLELNVWKKDSLIDSLESKLGSVELEKLKLENEVVLLKQRNAELESRVRSFKEEDEKLGLLMIENKVLECEKKKAEVDIGTWKLKCKELDMKLLEVEKRLSVGTPLTVQSEKNSDEDKDDQGTINTPHKLDMDHLEGFNRNRACGFEARVRNRLDFGLSGEGTPRKNITPTTPGNKPPFDATIEISDSDDNDDPDNKNVENSTGVGSGVILDSNDCEEENACYFTRPPMAKRRKVRKRAACVVNSDTENDSDDDNILISTLMSKKSSANGCNAKNDSCLSGDREKCTPKRRLRRAGESEEKDLLGKRKSKSFSGEEEEETDESSGEEGESLGGFIVRSSDESGSESNEGPNSGDDGLENESDGCVGGYVKVMSGLRRERKCKMDWEYEADMLADLGKYPELCMKAVCAIYRRQTSEEQFHQATLVHNGRGFSQVHAPRGSDLAKFLTDGDPDGDVNKTVDELQKFDTRGVEQCRKLAIHYSRQLFDIYKSREDPFFHP
ncbi:casein lytic proteinase B4 [Striga asiatica]|uniref:Casein lytic proteinase B4 n=1 Tax=Striga asiatica TaxID=4170 RepID=A0A5A7PN36_STRAF|nr:casein lytic proteinase B4 [Striga asiatica]